MEKRKLLKRESTVSMSEFVQKQRDESSNHKEIIDLCFRACHMWSQRHPERKEECFTPDVILRGFGPAPIHGSELFETIAHSYYDAVEDLHFQIEEIFHTGNLASGRAIYRWSCGGVLINPLFGNEPTQKRENFCGTDAVSIKDGKITELEMSVGLVNSTIAKIFMSAGDYLKSQDQK